MTDDVVVLGGRLHRRMKPILYYFACSSHVTVWKTACVQEARATLVNLFDADIRQNDADRGEFAVRTMALQNDGIAGDGKLYIVFTRCN
jgi:hypothetical protein